MKTSKPYLERQDWDLRLQVADCALVNQADTRADRPHLLKQLWRRVINLLVSNTELQVWQTTTEDGHLIWQAYDPVSHELVIRGSEDDMRAWIETRYYNQAETSEMWQQRQYQLSLLR
jgi:hypothetical protein